MLSLIKRTIKRIYINKDARLGAKARYLLCLINAERKTSMILKRGNLCIVIISGIEFTLREGEAKL